MWCGCDGLQQREVIEEQNKSRKQRERPGEEMRRRRERARKSARQREGTKFESPHVTSRGCSHELRVLTDSSGPWLGWEQSTYLGRH